MNSNPEDNIIHDIDNEAETEAFLLQIYDKNASNINFLTKGIQIFYAIAMVAIFLGEICLSISLSMINLHLLTSMIPLIIASVSLLVMGNLCFSLSNIFDEKRSIGMTISLIYMNLIGFSIIAFISLLYSKIIWLSHIKYILVFIPLFIVFAVSFGYAIFIFPAFKKLQLHYEIILIFLYLTCGLLSLCLFAIKMDRIDFQVVPFWELGLPLFFILGGHFLYSIIQFFMSKEKQYSFFLCLIGVLSLSIVTLALLLLKNDSILLNHNHWIETVLIIIATALIVIQRLIELYTSKASDD